MSERKIIFVSVLVFTLLAAVNCSRADVRIIYVEDDATGANDGSSWPNAYIYLQDALVDARNSVKPIEIRVAQGVYKPDLGAGITPGDERVSFQLINETAIKGGYAGFSQIDPNAREIDLYKTVLSGDINSNDIEVNDPGDLLDEYTRFGNSFNVIIGSNTNSTAVLDGFTITGGHIWVISSGRIVGNPLGGAGLLIYSGSPKLIDCTFINNATGNDGGGLLLYDNSNPELINCKYIGNYAGGGGGISCYKNSSPVLENCTFDNNIASGKGGAISNKNSNPILMNCSFTHNSAFRSSVVSNTMGGAVYCRDSNSVMTDCMFIENSADRGGGIYAVDSNSVLNSCKFESNKASSGGAIFNGYGQLIARRSIFEKNSSTAIYNYSERDSVFDNCTFCGNSTLYDGGAVHTNYGMFTQCIFAGNKSMGDYNMSGAVFHLDTIVFDSCTFVNNWAKYGSAVYGFGILHMKNCILRGTGNQMYVDDVGIPILVSYSNIQGGWAGEGNIDADPLFAEPGYWADADDPNVIVEPNDPNAVWVDGDYHLKSQAGRWDPNSQSWVIDDVTSPCIDAGDPNSSVGDEPEPNGGRINMGAYGGTAEASMSYIIEQ